MKPKVSVAIISYNHACFVGACLDSVLAQETPFAFEVVICDDGSKDGTTDIISDYAARYPRQLRAVLRTQNIGPTANCLDTYARCQGDYLAHMDADDQMLPGKLAKQATFLDDNPDCGLVAHPVAAMDAEGKRLPLSLPGLALPSRCKLDVLVRENGCFVHSSKMFRASMHPKDIDTSAGRQVVDFMLHLMHARTGHFGFLDEVLGLYRHLPGSLSAPGGRYAAAITQSYCEAFEYAKSLPVSADALALGQARFHNAAALHRLAVQDYEGFAHHLAISIRDGVFANRNHRVVYALRHSPWLVAWLSRLYLAMRRSGL